MLKIEFFSRQNRPSLVSRHLLATMDPPDPEPPLTPVPNKKTKKELTLHERQQIVSRLLFELQVRGVDGKFSRGTLKLVAGDYHVCPRTIRRVWERARQNFENPEVRQFRSSPRKKKCGRHRKWDPDEIREAVKLIPLFKRRTIRDLAHALAIPKSTLFRLKNDGDEPVIMTCTSALKPALTEQHKLLRVTFCLTKIDPLTRRYDHCYNSVHVDEKWFFITEKVLRLYIARGEEVPTRRCQNWEHLIKVMFLAAVARPRFDAEGVCTFDGKIGMFPFIERVAAQRTSKNRQKGTIETKVVPVNKNRYREFMIQKVVPAIKEKWPDRDRNIVIQQDGASAHIDEFDPAFCAAATSGSWNITLMTQSPKSPDLNVLDLSFFRALQSKQWSNGGGKTVDDVVDSVMLAFNEFDAMTLNFGWITLMTCFDDVITCHGDNDYAIQHIGKEKRLRDGTLPDFLIPSDEALEVFDMMEGAA